MKKVSNNGEYFKGETFSSESRGQPRKSNFHQHKHDAKHGSFGDDDEGDSHHHHRSEPAKNLVRVQLRRIQRLF